MTPANRAAWCEVLDLEQGDRVELVSDFPGPARQRLERMGATVVTETDPRGASDIVVVECPDRIDIPVEAWSRVREGGQLVIVTDNGRSPLRWIDGRAGTPGGPAIAPLPSIVDALASVGASHTQVFGLLRGSGSSPTVFRTDLPDVSRAVLAAAVANSGLLRRTTVKALSRLAGRGLVTPLVPAWMIVATDRPRSIEALTPTGRIGVELNAQGVVVLGPGPDGVEKFYRDPAARSATIMSLELLAAVGFVSAPRILDEPSPTRLRLQWVHGSDIDANNLSFNELAGWLRQAGSLLGDLQRRTLADDGTVLVHGDLWLGAMVADGDHIVAIIDWDDSHRGDPATDMRSLVAVVHDRVDFSDEDRASLIDMTYHAHQRAGGPERARSHG